MNHYTEKELKALPIGTELYGNYKRYTLQRIGRKYLYATSDNGREYAFYFSDLLYKSEQDMLDAYARQKRNDLVRNAFAHIPWKYQFSPEELDVLEPIAQSMREFMKKQREGI